MEYRMGPEKGGDPASNHVFALPLFLIYDFYLEKTN
jgi:hypothetical protein